MSQFTLYRNEDPASNPTYPYFVDVQNDLFDDLNSRVVIPLSPLRALGGAHAKRLCPRLRLDGDQFVLLTHQMTAIPKTILKAEVTSLDEARYEILGAIDMLIAGI